MIILNYFLYGNKITAEENEVIEIFQASGTPGQELCGSGD